MAAGGGSDSSASYIHMVQHLIEKCLIFKMSREECMDALAKHASINPVITSTVWNELEKENREFFQGYTTESKGKDGRMSEKETNQIINNFIAAAATSDDP